jgi:hypothetical protein
VFSFTHTDTVLHFGVRCDKSVSYDTDFEPPAEPSEKEPVSVFAAELRRSCVCA